VEEHTRPASITATRKGPPSSRARVAPRRHDGFSPASSRSGDRSGEARTSSPSLLPDLATMIRRSNGSTAPWTISRCTASSCIRCSRSSRRTRGSSSFASDSRHAVRRGALHRVDDACSTCRRRFGGDGTHGFVGDVAKRVAGLGRRRHVRVRPFCSSRMNASLLVEHFQTDCSWRRPTNRPRTRNASVSNGTRPTEYDPRLLAGSSPRRDPSPFAGAEHWPCVATLAALCDGSGPSRSHWHRGCSDEELRPRDGMLADGAFPRRTVERQHEGCSALACRL
jgi:hypothetical protein